jgi:hypothetical protein
MISEKEIFEDTKNRNFDNIALERVRKLVDPAFCKLHDELEECYYKNWKLGNSKPFFQFDVKKTPEESKLLFDQIHANLWQLHTLAKVTANSTLDAKDQYSSEKIDPTVSDTGDKESDVAREYLSKTTIDMLPIKTALQQELGLELA